jgi:hypothetical protein
MNSVLAHILILWAVLGVTLGVTLMLHRRGTLGRLPYAGVFGFVGAAFGVVIGMTTFFASQHYADVRAAAEREATALGDVAALTGSFKPAEGLLIREQLYCYATDVIDLEWPRNSDVGSPAVEGRQRALYVLLLRVGHQNPKPDSWYSRALNSSFDAGDQHQSRLLLSSPQIPIPLWILIYLGAAIILLFTFFFHLETRRQLIGMHVAVIFMLTAVVGVLAGLDSPTEGPFGLKPHAMSSVRALLVQDVPPAARANPATYCQKLPVPKREPSVLRSTQ